MESDCTLRGSTIAPCCGIVRITRGGASCGATLPAVWNTKKQGAADNPFSFWNPTPCTFFSLRPSTYTLPALSSTLTVKERRSSLIDEFKLIDAGGILLLP